MSNKLPIMPAAAGDATQDVLSRVRRALGRAAPLTSPPVPPAVSPDDLLPRLIAFLKEHNCRKLALPASPFLDKLKVMDGLARAGFQATRWPDMTLDALYDYDCGITDVYAAVAETGSLVIRSS